MNKTKRSPEFYKRIGALGGRAKVKKGFAVTGLQHLAGKVGGAVGRIGDHKLTEKQKAEIARSILERET